MHKLLARFNFSCLPSRSPMMLHSDSSLPLAFTCLLHTILIFVEHGTCRTNPVTEAYSFPRWKLNCSEYSLPVIISFYLLHSFFNLWRHLGMMNFTYQRRLKKEFHHSFLHVLIYNLNESIKHHTILCSSLFLPIYMKIILLLWWHKESMAHVCKQNILQTDELIIMKVYSTCEVCNNIPEIFDSEHVLL